MKLRFALATLALLLVMAMSASAEVVTIQNGLNGYSGTRCASMIGSQPDSNDSGAINQYMSIQAGLYSPVIKFVDMGIPQGATINSATLTIWAATYDAEVNTVKTYTLLKDWNQGTHAWEPASDGEITWNSAKHNQVPWEVPGALGVTDCAPAVDPSTVWIGNAWDWAVHDVTASLQQQADSGNFFGWVFRPISGTKYGAYRPPISGTAPVLVVDYTPGTSNRPIITNVNCSFSGTTATITWTTDVAASSEVDYGVDSTYGTTLVGTDGVTEHTVEIPTPFTPNMFVQHFRVRSSAPGLNEAYSDDYLMPTLYVYPESISVVPVASDSVAVYWDCRDYNDETIPGSREIFWGETTAYDNPGTLQGVMSVGGYDRKAIISGLQSNTTYHFKVKERQTTDDGVNTYLYGESGDLTFTTIGPNDFVATFQHGVNGYTGVADAGLQDGQSNNLGTNWLFVQPGYSEFLVKFTNLGLPPGSTVKNAYLQLYGAVFGEQQSYISCTGLLKDWNEGSQACNPTQDGECDWFYAVQPTVPWDVPGAKGATDRRATADDTITVTNWWAWRSWDVSSSLVEQVTTGNMYGWVFERDPAGTTLTTVFRQKEYAEAYLTPLLSVVLTLGDSGSKIGDLQGLADGTEVALINKKATLSFVFDEPMGFYAQEQDRSSGIRVAMNDIMAEGVNVVVTGTMATIASTGERYVQATGVVVLGGSGLPASLAVTNKSLGGAGLSNVGLLVMATGKVHNPSGWYFYLDDGSGNVADNGMSGIKVISELNVDVLEGDMVSVIGVSSLENDGSHTYGVVRTSGPDLVILR